MARTGKKNFMSLEDRSRTASKAWKLKYSTTTTDDVEYIFRGTLRPPIAIYYGFV